MKKALFLLPFLILAWCWNNQAQEQAISDLDSYKAEIQARQEALKIKESNIIIPRWEAFLFENVAVKINDVFTDDQWNTIIRIESENQWKEPSNYFIKPSETFFITEDDAKFEAIVSRQVDKDRPEWYAWCVSCSNNPWKKAVEDIIFDTANPWKYLILLDYSTRTQIKFEL